MAKYAAYRVEEWLFDVHADSAAEALKIADHQDSSVTHVEVVSESDGGKGAA